MSEDIIEGHEENVSVVEAPEEPIVAESKPVVESPFPLYGVDRNLKGGVVTTQSKSGPKTYEELVRHIERPVTPETVGNKDVRVSRPESLADLTAMYRKAAGKGEVQRGTF